MLLLASWGIPKELHFPTGIPSLYQQFGRRSSHCSVPLVPSFQQLIQLSQEYLDLAPINLPFNVKFLLAVNGTRSIAKRRNFLSLDAPRFQHQLSPQEISSITATSAADRTPQPYSVIHNQPSGVHRVLSH
jgi:hypothetical protein